MSGTSPAHSRSNVVLPAPFGPRSSTISPRDDVEIRSRERGEVAEHRHDVAEGDNRLRRDGRRWSWRSGRNATAELGTVLIRRDRGFVRCSDSRVAPWSDRTPPVASPRMAAPDTTTDGPDQCRDRTKISKWDRPRQPQGLAVLGRWARQGPHRHRAVDVRVRRLPAVGHRASRPHGRRTRWRTTSTSCWRARCPTSPPIRRDDRARRHRSRRHAAPDRHRPTAPATSPRRYRSQAQNLPSFEEGDVIARLEIPSHRRRQTTSSPGSRSPTSRRVPATTPRPRCRASSATPPSPGTAPRTVNRSTTSTRSRPATRSSSPPRRGVSSTSPPVSRSLARTTTRWSPRPTRRSPR